MNISRTSYNRILADKALLKRATRYFNSPAALVRFLDKQHFNIYEIEAILDSMWLFEAVTEFGGGAGGGKGNTGTFKAFLAKYDITPRCSRINRLVLSKNPNAEPNAEGIPCHRGKTVLGGNEILVPLGTPACCDPTTETYACM